METCPPSDGGPAPPLKRNTSWTDAIQASYERAAPTRSQLSPVGSPVPSESDIKPPIPAESGSPEQQGSDAASDVAPHLTDFAGQRLAYARPLGVHQSAVAPRVLSYPSSLHRAGRLMVMTVVTSLCVLPQLQRLPDVDLLQPLLPLVESLDLETFTGGVRLNLMHI